MWLQEGSKREDAGTLAGYVTGSARSLNHFHDPTKPLSEAGLSDLPLPPKISAVRWAQNPAEQSGATGGDWTWQKVRDHQYAYLTALTGTVESSSLASLLMGLGYQMHLIQDMSQPNHVRNDTHIADGKGWRNGFETWAKNHPDKVNVTLTNYSTVIKKTASVDLTVSYENNLAPVARLSDTRDNLLVDSSVIPSMSYLPPSKSFSQGLAEYTNANFYSEDSVFAAERHAVGNNYFFPYPQKSETDVQQFIDNNLPTIPFFDFNKTYQTFRIGKPATTGESLKCIAKPTSKTAKYYRMLGEGRFFYGSFVVDEECFEEQLTKLLPRATGYSIALLDYFFRGSMELTIPADAPASYNRIVLSARNTTPNEPMTNGTIELMLAYRTYAKENPAAPSGKMIASDIQRIRIPEKNGVRAIDSATGTRLEFDLSTTPLPALAANNSLVIPDVSLVLVYRGDLGNEKTTTATGKAVAFEEIELGLNDIALSLPGRGVYAATGDAAIGATFSDFAVAAKNISSTTPSTAGTTELLIMYRQPAGDPYQSTAVTLSNDYYYVSATQTTAQGISGTTKQNLLYSLTAAKLPVLAADMHAYLIHTASDRTVTRGNLDSSEPTPVDVFNTTDYTCLNGTWYRYNETAAMAIVDSNSDGIAERSDIYPHTISNISFLAGAADAVLDARGGNTLFAAGPLLTGQKLRMGYIVTDYTNRFAVAENRTPQAGDPFPHATTNRSFTGTGYVNNDESQGSMYSFRGSRMWWGEGVIFINQEYNGTCSFDALNTKLGL